MLSRIVVSDSEEIKQAFTTMIFSIITIVFNAFVLIFFMLKLEWKLSLACIAWNVLFFLLTMNFSKNIQRRQVDEREEYGTMISLYKDFIQGHTDFRFFSDYHLFQEHLKPFKDVDLAMPAEQSSETIESITVSNLSVKYGDKIILDNINEEFKSNKVYCIKGKSGAGKSTFIKALLNLLPYSGTVLYNGIDSKTIPLSEVYKQTGYVQQDVYILNDSIYNNIAFYNKEFNEDEIDDVLAELSLSKLCEQKQIVLGTQGNEKISGGEKKRIALVRLLLAIKNKSIIIFDETFTNIEESLKQTLVKIILPHCANKIVFIISHDENLWELIADYEEVHIGTK